MKYQPTDDEAEAEVQRVALAIADRVHGAELAALRAEVAAAESHAARLLVERDAARDQILCATDIRAEHVTAVDQLAALRDENEALADCLELLRAQEEAGRMVEAARRILSSVAESMTEHAYQELASALESPPRIAGKTAGFDQPGREHTAGDALGLRRDR